MTKWARLIDKVEAVSGLLATIFIGFMTPVIVFLMLADNRLPQGAAWNAIVFGVVPILLMLPLIVLAIVGLCDCFPEWINWGWARTSLELPAPPVPLPLAVVMTIRLPQIPWLLRPVLSVWWFAHFAAGAGFGFALYLATAKKLNGDPVTRIIVPLLLDFGILFATNLYLLLAVAVLFGTPHLWLKLWRARFVFDLILVCAARIFFSP